MNTVSSTRLSNGRAELARLAKRIPLETTIKKRSIKSREDGVGGKSASYAKELVVQERMWEVQETFIKSSC